MLGRGGTSDVSGKTLGRDALGEPDGDDGGDGGGGGSWRVSFGASALAEANGGQPCCGCLPSPGLRDSLGSICWYPVGSDIKERNQVAR